MAFDIRQKDIWSCFSAFKESTFEQDESDTISESFNIESHKQEQHSDTLENHENEYNEEDIDSIDMEVIQKNISIHRKTPEDTLSSTSKFTTASELETFEMDMQDSELFVLACSDCKSFSLVYKDGQHVCSKCGVIQQRHLSHEAEYRCYAEGNGTKGINPERVGMPTNNLLPESSLGTLIGHRSGENQNIKRMIQYNTWHQMPYKERSLYRICLKISSRCKRYGLPNIIIERAQELYHITKDVVMTRGVNRDIGASTFFACKDQGVPRSQREIAEIYDISPTDINRGIQHFREIWRLAKRNGETINDDTSNPIDYIDRYCSLLPINSDIKHIAEFIAMKSIMNNLVNNNTSPSIAAGAVYLACHVCQQNVSKKQVAQACKTSEVTISKCFKKLNDNKLLLLPKSIIAKYEIK